MATHGKSQLMTADFKSLAVMAIVTAIITENLSL